MYVTGLINEMNGILCQQWSKIITKQLSISTNKIENHLREAETRNCSKYLHSKTESYVFFSGSFKVSELPQVCFVATQR